MAGSTYSTNLKIELMTTGENSGTWGDVTNTNLGTALEQAVVGYGNPDYASDANLTISITNSNAAQAARALVLNVTSTFGSLTATRELVVPTIQKQYIVQNNTAGGQSITVKTSAGTGITVPNGRKAHLYVDGTNVIQMFDFVDINGGAIDGTTIGASSASTGAFTTLNASGATTLDGNVTLGNASGDTVTVTGTIASNLLFTDNTYDIGASGATRPRNLYLAGAATIGGNLSVGGTLTLTGGLTLNGNVTVGDSASDTLTINSTVTSNLIFTDNTYDIGASGATRPRNLFIAGNITAGGNQTLTGSLTVDSTTDSSSTTTGSIQTDGGLGVAKALYVGSTANIAGAVTLSGGTANGVTYLNGSKVLTSGSALTFDGTNLTVANGDLTIGTNGKKLYVNYIANNSGTDLNINGSTNSIFTIAGSEQMRLTSTGLGIGTSSPAAKLQVKDGTDINVRVGALGGYASVYSINDAGSAYQFLRIDATDLILNTYSGGNVGIGTSSPNKLLTLYSSTNDVEVLRINANGGAGGVQAKADIGFGYYDGVTEANAAIGFEEYGTASAGGNLLFKTRPDGASASTRPTERMIITQAGTVGIGTSSPSVKLDVAGDIKMGTGLASSQFLMAGSSYGQVVVSGTYYLDATTQIYRNGAGTTEYSRYTSAGNLLIGTTSVAVNQGIGLTLGSSTGATLSLSTSLAAGTTASPINTDLSFRGYNNYEVARIRSWDESASTAWGYLTFATAANVGTGVVEAMRINNGQQVGIGTTAPAARVEIFQTSTTVPNLRLRYNSTSYFADHILAPGGQYTIYTPPANGVTSGDMLLRAGNTIQFASNNNPYSSVQMTLDANGALCVGTTIPTTTFKTVAVGNGSNVGTMTNDTGYSDFGMGSNTYFNSTWKYVKTGECAALFRVYGYGGTFLWQRAVSGTANANVTWTYPMILDENAKLTINDQGGTQYSTNLYVNGAIAARNGGVDGTFQNAFVAGYTSNYTEQNIIQTAVSSAAGGSGFRFQVSNGSGSSGVTSVMTVTRASVGMVVPLTVNPGDADPVDITYNGQRVGLNITQESSTYNNIFRFKNNQTKWFDYTLTANTTTPTLSIVNSNGTGVALTWGSTSWSSTSDERVKDIIEPITNAVAKVRQLRAVIGKYKTDAEGIRRAFLLAQDVQNVLPEAVGESAELNSDGFKELVLRYTETIPLLVAAINELGESFESYVATHP